MYLRLLGKTCKTVFLALPDSRVSTFARIIQSQSAQETSQSTLNTQTAVYQNKLFGAIAQTDYTFCLEKFFEVSLNIKKCTNVSGRALHQSKKAHCGKLAYQLYMPTCHNGLFYTDEDEMKGSARNVCTFFNVQ